MEIFLYGNHSIVIYDLLRVFLLHHLAALHGEAALVAEVVAV